MEDYKIDIMIETGPNARTVQINLNPFTLVGATTRSGLLTAPMRARFGITSRLEYYNSELLSIILERSANILNVSISSQAAIEIAGRSRGTPRIANGLLRRVRDFAQIKGNGKIDIEITKNISNEIDNIILSNDGEAVIINKNSTKGVLLKGFLAEDFSKLNVLQNENFLGFKTLKENENKSYTDLEKIKKQVSNAKGTFRKYGWPTIDVTRKSVEETAASIIKIYEIKNR